MQIVLDLHLGEASWQACVTENTIGIVKDTMTRIVLERPDLKSTKCWQQLCWRIMRRSGFEVSLRLSGHLDVHRTGINHSSTAATKPRIRAFWNICKGWRQPETRIEWKEERFRLLSDKVDRNRMADAEMEKKEEVVTHRKRLIAVWRRWWDRFSRRERIRQYPRSMPCVKNFFRRFETSIPPVQMPGRGEGRRELEK